MNLNSKLRSDSVFAQLTNEQIELLEDWLFEEKLSYKEVLQQAQQQWGVKSSPTALGRFYRRLALQRSEERRLETVALCLEGLAAKNDGTLQAGLLALANQCAIELLVEQPKSIREFATLLRALTSAQGMEMKRVDAQRDEEKRKQWELEEKERKEKEAKMKEVQKLRWAEENAYWEAREAKRKATIAAKAAAKKAEEDARARTEAVKGEAVVLVTNVEKEATSPGPNGFPSPPRDSFPIVDERFALSGPPEAERVTEGGVSAIGIADAVVPIGDLQLVKTEPPKGGTPNDAPKLEVVEAKVHVEFEGLSEGERNGDFAINRAGNIS